MTSEKIIEKIRAAEETKLAELIAEDHPNPCVLVWRMLPGRDYGAVLLNDAVFFPGLRYGTNAKAISSDYFAIGPEDGSAGMFIDSRRDLCPTSRSSTSCVRARSVSRVVCAVLAGSSATVRRVAAVALLGSLRTKVQASPCVRVHGRGSHERRRDEQGSASDLRQAHAR
jgi:hypothetical protein